MLTCGLHISMTHNNDRPDGLPLPPNPARPVWSESWVLKGGRGSNLSTAEVAPFVTNYMYPIVHFAGIHPCGLVGLHTDTLGQDVGGRGWLNAHRRSHGDEVAQQSHEDVLALAINTVWGDNDRSSWHPTNGLCLAWPSATRITNGSTPGRATALLDRYEGALKATMHPNFWPDMGGGGIEQVGATVAVDELLLQSHEGFIVLFPAWERGLHAAAFITLRARGAFLFSAAIDAKGRVVPKVAVYSEMGEPCRMISPWSSNGGGGGASSNPPFVVAVRSSSSRKTNGSISEVPKVVFAGLVGRSVATWAFNTTARTEYVLNPADYHSES